MKTEPPQPCLSSPARRVEDAVIVSHRQTAANTYRLRVECPGIAASAVAGQFAMLRIADRVDPLLGRPLAFYDTYRSADDDTPQGERSERRFGQTALLTLGRDRAAAGERVTFCWGASRGAAFGDIDDFRRAGLDVHLATLDGSAGQRGTVIDLLDSLFSPSAGETAAPRHVACCGPDGMMAAVSRWSEGRGLGCHVSLEAPMACGIGICFTCVARVKDDEGGWDYKRTCIEGPVFAATSIDWS